MCLLLSEYSLLAIHAVRSSIFIFVSFRLTLFKRYRVVFMHAFSLDDLLVKRFAGRFFQPNSAPSCKCTDLLNYTKYNFPCKRENLLGTSWSAGTY